MILTSNIQGTRIITRDSTRKGPSKEAMGEVLAERIESQECLLKGLSLKSVPLQSPVSSHCAAVSLYSSLVTPNPQ